MQIPTSAGVLANSVLPITPTQGALLSQVGETAGSTSFAPVAAVSASSVVGNTPAQRPVPDSPVSDAHIGHSSKADQTSEFTPYSPFSSNKATADNSRAEGSDSANSTQSAPANIQKEQNERSQQETEQAERQQQRQEQQDLKIIRELSQRDSEVRAHEQAHSAVGGQYAGSANYTYQRGPDGVSYAVGGEVPIDVGPVNGDPRATLEKMKTVQRAALAPAEPSSQDRRVAAMAAQQASQARVEIVSESRESVLSETSSETGAVDPLVNKDFVKASTVDQPLFSQNENSTNSLYASDSQGDLPVLNDRIAKINEIILAISQSDTANATGKLLDDVV